MSTTLDYVCQALLEDASKMPLDAERLWTSNAVRPFPVIFTLHHGVPIPFSWARDPTLYRPVSSSTHRLARTRFLCIATALATFRCNNNIHMYVYNMLIHMYTSTHTYVCVYSIHISRYSTYPSIDRLLIRVRACKHVYSSTLC